MISISFGMIFIFSFRRNRAGIVYLDNPCSTWQQKARMAGMGMSAAARNAAMLQREVVKTEIPDLRRTSPTWS